MNNNFYRLADPIIDPTDADWTALQEVLPDWAKDHNAWEQKFMEELPNSHLLDNVRYSPDKKLFVGNKYVDNMILVDPATGNTIDKLAPAQVKSFITNNFYNVIKNLLDSRLLMSIWNRNFAHRQLYGMTPYAFIRKYLYNLRDIMSQNVDANTQDISTTINDNTNIQDTSTTINDNNNTNTQDTSTTINDNNNTNNNDNDNYEPVDFDDALLNGAPQIYNTLAQFIPANILDGVYLDGGEEEYYDKRTIALKLLKNDEQKYNAIIDKLCEAIPGLKRNTINIGNLSKAMANYMENLPERAIWWETEDDIQDRIKQSVQDSIDAGVVVIGQDPTDDHDWTGYKFGNHKMTKMSFINQGTPVDNVHLGDRYCRSLLNKLYNEELKPNLERDPELLRRTSRILYGKGYSMIRAILESLGAQID